MEIRRARREDAAQLLAIYRPYLEQTAITFETQVPTIEEFERRIEKTLANYPYLVAEEAGQLVGYAYASAYYQRAAYDWTVELSVYVDTSKRSKGVGSALYEELEEQLKKQGKVNFLACIALPNEASILFHQKRGYIQVAHFPKIGYKFGRWHDIVWLQKRLADD
ncbi:GNAT family N-acetyltransferase [Streptococcus oricebi]|uniref:GNAT family N-acetyltransferase n=1 Tax=Streptococcus oricebi TaxID=1547447 RepID=A0ABS5B352_9STRE|nr:GNAT family N-acetyltransferase [Streptococcus oricebi]MBP2623267.1 GNAT family N-acetyltransferase [Streptococcus oricebi]